MALQPLKASELRILQELITLPEAAHGNAALASMMPAAASCAVQATLDVNPNKNCTVPQSLCTRCYKMSRLIVCDLYSLYF
jgi:hypothetical protein